MATFQLTRRRRLRFWFHEHFGQRFGRRKRVDGCVEFVCRPQMPHRRCSTCGSLTDSTALTINPKSLRRQKVQMCFKCKLREGQSDDGSLRRRRTEHDWSVGLPDQFPGPTRALVKDFLHSGERERLIDGLNPLQAASFNFSVSSLGMASEAYAEIRGHQVWLRRLNDGAVVETG